MTEPPSEAGRRQASVTRRSPGVAARSCTAPGGVPSLSRRTAAVVERFHSLTPPRSVPNPSSTYSPSSLSVSPTADSANVPTVSPTPNVTELGTPEYLHDSPVPMASMRRGQAET